MVVKRVQRIGDIAARARNSNLGGRGDQARHDNLSGRVDDFCFFRYLNILPDT